MTSDSIKIKLSKDQQEWVKKIARMRQTSPSYIAQNLVEIALADEVQKLRRLYPNWDQSKRARNE